MRGDISEAQSLESLSAVDRNVKITRILEISAFLISVVTIRFNVWCHATFVPKCEFFCVSDKISENLENLMSDGIVIVGEIIYFIVF